MYKLLVVDDEYLVRRGIKETIDWFRYGVEIVGEATNGADGFELAKRVKPDIIISDIKMPVMDGMEFVSKIKEENLDLEVIILSGYKDFNYSKDTLENGAYSYLLKPIDNDELVQKVLEAIESLNQKRATKKIVTQINVDLPILKKRIIEELINGEYEDLTHIKNQIETYKIEIINQGFVIYGMIDHPEMINDDLLVRDICDYLVICFQEELTNLNISYSNIFMHNGVFLFLVNLEDLESVIEISKNAVSRFEERFSQIISIGIGLKYESLEDIKNSYQTAVKATLQKLFLAINSIDAYQGQVTQYKPVIKETMDYIAKHYGENISVKMVADSIFVSESHLLHAFKENVGKTFNECLTEYRILIAKKLLRESNVRIYEVAEKVGYPDVKYFSQIFKKKTGVTPSEFMNKNE